MGLETPGKAGGICGEDGAEEVVEEEFSLKGGGIEEDSLGLEGIEEDSLAVGGIGE